MMPSGDQYKPGDVFIGPDNMGGLNVWDPYNEIISQLQRLHDRKKNDYAASDNQFSNFEASARYAGVTVNQVFDVLIGTKIARLRNLKESGKDVQNEAIEDTEIDLANYILIKKAYNIYKGRMIVYGKS